MKWSGSGRINISTIKIPHRILKKDFLSLLCKDDLWAVDRAYLMRLLKMIG